MSDLADRQEKVAAGLKKLKQFQQRSGRKSKPKTDTLNSPKTSNCKSSPDLSNSSKPANQENGQNSLITSNNSLNTLPRAASSEVLSTIDLQPTSPQVPRQISPKNSLQKINSTDELLSSRESIRQITQRINGLMSQTRNLVNGDGENVVIHTLLDNGNDLSTLQRRNQELAAMLNEQQQSNQQLQFQVQDLTSRLNRLHKEHEKEKEVLREKAYKEQVAVKDQLQVHIQTIGILVAEKTELQSTLNQSQQTAKQKAAEVEELQGRLRASRHRGNDLERDLATQTAASQQLEKTNKELAKEVDRLKMETYKTGKTNEELTLQKDELGEKLKSKVSENHQLREQLSDLNSKLTMQELYIGQLTNNGSSDPSNPSSSLATMQQLEDLHQEKLELERIVADNKETFQRLVAEKESQVEQYQSFVKQLNSQLDSIKEELRLVNEDRQTIVDEKRKLEKQIMELQQQPEIFNEISPETNQLTEDLEKLRKENDELKLQLESQINDNGQFANLIQEKETQITELEQDITRLKDQSLDSGQLLERMQSDKVAASRAVTQNRELKRQLQELQDEIVRLNNDKLEITERFDGEHHVAKELGERLVQQEEELRELRDQINTRDKQLQDLEDSKTKHQLKEHQIVDRMRHYEAQGQLSEMLQQELVQAQERIKVLSNQNSQLRMALAKQAEASVVSDNKNEDADQSKRNDLVASLSASVHQLELERDQLMRQVESQQDQRESLKAQMKEYAANRKNETGPENPDGIISKKEYESLKDNMNKLEERFRKTMDQIAELTDQKQQLEHLVTQLQGETDTIADYITLYQVQRGVMKQRAEEKDEYISQLARDREELKNKLSELQNLMIKLMEEKKALQISNASKINKTPGNAMPLTNDNQRDSGQEIIGQIEKRKLDNKENGGEILAKKPTAGTENTAKKIMDLLNDIGTSNLIEKPTIDTFHPCPVCSGRLMTV